MFRNFRIFCISFLVCLTATAGFAQEGGRFDLFDIIGAKSPASEHFGIRAIASHTQVTPGQEFYVALEVDIAEGWVYYSPAQLPNQEFAVMPAQIKVTSDEFEAGELLFPTDHTHDTILGDLVATHNVYEGKVVFYVPLTAGQDLTSGEYEIFFQAGGQICADVCLVVNEAASAIVAVDGKAVSNPLWGSGLADGLAEAQTVEKLQASHASKAVPTYGNGSKLRVSDMTPLVGLGLAVLAGLILNIMPCVLPVIPLRILSVVQMARESRRRFVTLGLAFAGGIVLFFVSLAAVNVILRSITEATFSLSDHFQFIGVRIGLTLIIVALAANLLGAFNIIVPRKVAEFGEGVGGQRQGHLASAGMGLMMAILATPCSFAILAAALAWAQIQPLWLGTIGIILIGVGMAVPHAILTAFPGLLKKLPRPGKWMEIFKQSMGFLLLLVAVWLISTTSENTYPFWIAGYCVVLAYGLWMWGSWLRYDAMLSKKLIVRIIAVALVVGAGFWMLTPPREPALKFANFDQTLIDQAKADGKTVLVKFTASWCISCKWIDKFVYGDEEVVEALRASDVVTIKGNVTNNGAAASRMLYDQLNEPGPPVTLIILPDGKAVRLVGKFSKEDLFGVIPTYRK